MKNAAKHAKHKEALVSFTGFPRESLTFLRALKRNNRREWFQAHREDYEQFVRNPSRAFLEALGPVLTKKFTHVLVSNRSMFRINRDTRFSTDKSPYKTWVGYDFKDQRGDRDQAPSLYLGWDPTGVVYGAGHYGFESTQRAKFRTRITEGPSAHQFTKIVRKMKSGRHFDFRGFELKKIPPGFDPKHPNAEFLRCNALYVLCEEDMPATFYRSDFVKTVLKRFEETRPLMDWLADQRLPSGVRAESTLAPLAGDVVKIHRDDF